MRNSLTVDHMSDSGAINLSGKELADGQELAFVKTSSSIGLSKINKCILAIYWLYEIYNNEYGYFVLFVNCYQITIDKYKNPYSLYASMCILYICIFTCM